MAGKGQLASARFTGRLLPLFQALGATSALLGASICALAILVASIGFDRGLEQQTPNGPQTLKLEVPLASNPIGMTPDPALAHELPGTPQLLGEIAIGPGTDGA